MNQLWLTIIAAFSLFIAYEAQAQNESDALSSQEPTTMVTIDAAFGYDLAGRHYLILFSGAKSQVLTDYTGNRIGSKREFRIPSDMHVQAAHTMSDTPFNRRYYGDKYGISFKTRTEIKKLKYGRKRAFLQHGGPDAAGRRGKHVFFFKGCQMVARIKFGKWGKIQDMTAKGLPCDIHAAWTEQDKMVLLKGDQYWTWEQDDSVTGPHNFHDKYHASGWTLAPVREE